MDADTILDSRFVEKTIDELEQDPEARRGCARGS
jgi:hypothetical protein